MSSVPVDAPLRRVEERDTNGLTTVRWVGQRFLSATSAVWVAALSASGHLEVMLMRRAEHFVNFAARYSCNSRFHSVSARDAPGSSRWFAASYSGIGGTNSRQSAGTVGIARLL